MAVNIGIESRMLSTNQLRDRDIGLERFLIGGGTVRNLNKNLSYQRIYVLSEWLRDRIIRIHRIFGCTEIADLEWFQVKLSWYIRSVLHGDTH